jgi:transposase
MDNLLKSLGLQHNRPRYAPKLGYDPQAKAKMDAITDVLSSPMAGNHILFEDECDLHLLPTIRAMWMRCGKQTRIPTPGTNQKKNIFGASDIRTGSFIYQIFYRERSVEFIEFLECIASRYPTGRIHVILDNYSIHKSRAAQEWLSKHPKVKLCFRPCYKPQLNLVEKIWWPLKAAVTANRLYGLMNALIDAVIAFLDSLTPCQIQTLAA